MTRTAMGVQPVQLERERWAPVQVVGEGGEPVPSMARTDVRVFEASEERTVTELRGLRPGEWRVLVYVDALASAPGELAAAASALTPSAPDLTRLGPVTVVVADDLAEPWVEDVEEPGELDEVWEELRASRFDVPGGPSDDFLAGRRRLFIDSLARFDALATPSLVVVVGDPNGERALSDDGEPAAEAAGRFAVAVAGLDWLALVLQVEPGGESPLARESGGEAVASGEELARALQRVGERLWLGWRSPLQGPTMRPLRYLGSGDDWTVRGPGWVSTASADHVLASRARYLLVEGESGALEVTATAAFDSGEHGRPELKVETLTGLGDLVDGSRISSRLRLSLVVDRLDAPPSFLHYLGEGRSLARAESWLVQSRLDAGDEVRGVVVVVEDLLSGEWGAADVDLEGDEIGMLGAETVVERVDLRAPETESREGEADEEERLVRLIPPRERTLTGRQTFAAMSLNEYIRRVVFFLDGAEVAADDARPFNARIDLGDEPAPREVKVVAYDRAGRVLGEDSVVVNRRLQRFAVDIVSVAGDPASGAVEVTADVSVPSDSRIEKVDFFWNDELQATRREGPFTARLDSARRTGSDFVRVVATLAGGESLEDVELLGVPGLVEEVRVNLVEIYAVVTSAEGEPLRDLGESDFTVRLGGREVELERFGLAEDIPLDLGLVIDTSQSMDVLMQDTKIAAIQFLSDVVTPKDRAFLVDFDTKPRLARGLTGSLPDLVNALGSLVAEGNTALYDAILFSTLNFDDKEDRRALILLTDGDDYRSRYSSKRAAEQARAGGVPVYMISLAALDALRPAFRKTDLEYIAKATGGRVFYVDSRDQLRPTYARIARELRSQFVLTFATPSELSDKELEKIQVDVARPGATVRAVVAGRSVQTR